jgi:hypothetical protein
MTERLTGRSATGVGPGEASGTTERGSSRRTRLARSLGWAGHAGATRVGAGICGLVLVGAALFGLIHIVGGTWHGNPRAAMFGVALSTVSLAALALLVGTLRRTSRQGPSGAL